MAEFEHATYINGVDYGLQVFSAGRTNACPLDSQLSDNTTQYASVLLANGEVVGNPVNAANYCMTFKLVLTRLSDNVIIQQGYASSNIPGFPDPL